jgi:hypothetical protein
MTEDEIRLLSDIFSGAPAKPAPSISEVPFMGERSIAQEKMQETLREREDARRLALEKDFASRPIPEKLAGAAESAGFIGSTVGRSLGYPFAELYGRATDQPKLGQTFLEGATLPESDLGLEYTVRFGEAMEPVAKALEASKIPEITPGMLTAPVRLIEEGAQQAARVGQKAVSQAAQRLRLSPDLMPLRQSSISNGVKYETKQEGPFYRVSAQGSAEGVRGNKESSGASSATAAGSTRGDVPQPIADAQLDEIISQPDNFVRSVATRYAEEVNGRPYELPEMESSSLKKQAPVGRVFMLAATDDPQYKSKVFDAYSAAMPEVIERSGAKTYDELVEAAYRQLAKETDEQFKRLPVSMSFHRFGEGNYENSRDMLRDIYGNKHLYVFQGGEPHPYLSKVDPVTGLNDNEKFRAVHDFFGHAIHGNQFGPKGEEIAWLAHSQMYSPLARLAMTTETRGQNSVVNYTPLNAQLKATIAEFDNNIYEARRRGLNTEAEKLEATKKKLFDEFQYAPQKGLLLPPEMLTPEYRGETPEYLRELIQPEPGTTVREALTHFSRSPDLSMTDPAMYGKGIRGEEMARLSGAPDVRPRTFFYTGESPKPEPGLGPYRYGAEAELYDLSADPLRIKTLARESLRNPISSNVNPGLVDPSEALTAAERVLRDYGYPGYTVPERGAATIFSPLEVKRFARGGRAMRAVAEAGKKAKEAKESKKVEAPEIKTSGKIARLEQKLKEVSGKDQSRRLQRAADEIEGLERMFHSRALEEAFRGRAGYPFQGVMTMKPEDFKNWASTLEFKFPDGTTRLGSHSEQNIADLQEILRRGRPFREVPYLTIGKGGGLPMVTGHEGRHRTRAMAAEGYPSTLVSLFPNRAMEFREVRNQTPEQWRQLVTESMGPERLMLPEYGMKKNPKFERAEAALSKAKADQDYDRRFGIEREIDRYFQEGISHLPDLETQMQFPEIYAKGGRVVGAVTAAGKKAKQEQKMLQGFYRGYAGDYDAAKAAAQDSGVFVSPQRAVAEYYAEKRAGQTGLDPHLEMILADPFSGRGYGHSTMGTGKNPPMVTRARELAPEDVEGRTQLKKKGGLACL